VSGIVPGVECRPLKKLEPDATALLSLRCRLQPRIVSSFNKNAAATS
jgi:hypothetical protein